MMERLIVISEASPPLCEIDEEKFSIFMQRKPIWVHYSISQDSYLKKSNEEKAHMINEYYRFMVKGNILLFVVFLSGLPQVKRNNCLVLKKHTSKTKHWKTE